MTPSAEADELARLRSENDRLRGALESITAEFERAVREADRPRGGQHVRPGGDFVAAIRLPSFLGRARWWARELRAALEDPGKTPTHDPGH